MPDSLGIVYRPPGSRGDLDNSGGAAVFPQSKQSPIDAYLEFFENERKREAAKENKKPYSLPSDFSGENTALGRVFDPDITPLSQELQQIKDADIYTRVHRESGEMTDDDYLKAKTQLNTAKYGMFLPKAIQSSRDRRFFDTEYPKFSANPELYPSQTRDYWQQYDELPIGQRIDPEMTKQLAQIDYSKKFNDVGMETHTTKNKVVNPDGSTTENDVTTVTPTNLRIGAERIIKDNDAYTEAMKNRYKSEFPNEQTDVSNPKFVDWVMEGIRTKKGLKVSTAYIEGRAPQSEENKKPKVSGNTVTVGNAKWTYYVQDGEEIWTMSRTDATENKIFDFERPDPSDPKKMEQVSGRIKNIRGKNGIPITINIIDEYDREQQVPYGTQTTNNIAKIKNEFNSDPFTIRQQVTGSLDVPKGTATGTKATGIKSNTGGKAKQKLTGTKAQFEGAAKKKGMTAEEYETWLVQNGYEIEIK